MRQDAGRRADVTQARKRSAERPIARPRAAAGVQSPLMLVY
jgi:hypothetical protein